LLKKFDEKLVQSELPDVKLSSVKLLGHIFAVPCHGLAKEFQPLL